MARTATTSRKTAKRPAPRGDVKQVAKRRATAVAQPIDYGEHTGAGFEDTDSSHFSVPFLALLQGLSPQVDRQKDAYIKGAEPGMMINNVTQELWDFDDEINFIPCWPQHVFVEWKKRDNGGGFIAIHEPGSEIVRAAIAASSEFGHYEVEDNDLVETFYMYGLRVDPNEGPQSMIVAFTATKIKKYKGWMTQMRHLRGQPPLFAHVFRIESVRESNNKGEFYNFKIGFAGGDAESSRVMPNSEEFVAAVSLYDLGKQGIARGDYTTTETRDEEEIPYDN